MDKAPRMERYVDKQKIAFIYALLTVLYSESN